MSYDHYFLFLAGTSQVGKTEYFVNYPPLINDMPVIKEGMAVRDIRATIGNPSWDKLMSNLDLMLEHQKLVLNVFETRCRNMIDTVRSKDKPHVALFERSLYDNVGYTYAFLHCIHEWGADDMERVGKFTEGVEAVYKNIRDHNIAVINLYEPIDHRYPYDVQNHARPPQNIRMLCDEYVRREAIRATRGNLRKGFDLPKWIKNVWPAAENQAWWPKRPMISGT